MNDRGSTGEVVFPASWFGPWGRVRPRAGEVIEAVIDEELELALGASRGSRLNLKHAPECRSLMGRYIHESRESMMTRRLLFPLILMGAVGALAVPLLLFGGGRSAQWIPLLVIVALCLLIHLFLHRHHDH